MFRGVSRSSLVAFALLVGVLAYLAVVFALALIVLGQGLPRGEQAAATATIEATTFDTLALGGVFVVSAVFAVALMIDASSRERRPQRQPRRFRRAFGVVVCLCILLALFDFGVAGAMGWHSFGPGI